MPETITLHRLGKSDLRITGKVLAKVRQRFAQRPEGDIWDSVILMELSDRSWVTISQRAAPNLPHLIGDYKRIMRPSVTDASSSDAYGGQVDSEADADYHMIRNTMGVLGWSQLAKQLATTLDWDVVDDLRVD